MRGQNLTQRHEEEQPRKGTKNAKKKSHAKPQRRKGEDNSTADKLRSTQMGEGRRARAVKGDWEVARIGVASIQKQNTR
jgi:hypothetical protein